MRGLSSILSLFRNEFNKFNNTRAQMLDSFYHMTNTLNSHFWQILLHGVISLPDALSYDNSFSIFLQRLRVDC